MRIFGAVGRRVFSISMMLAMAPAAALADFCDILASNASEACRMKARAGGSSIHDSWLRLKPEQASQPKTGAKGYFVSGTTPAVGTLGTAASGKQKLTVDCFANKRSMRLDALPYMLGLANGKNEAFNLTFSIDAKPPFTEKWALDWHHAELRAQEGSRLATELQHSLKLTVKTEGILGRKSAVGYVFDTQGFDEMNSGLCR